MKLFNYRKPYDKDSLSIDEIGDNPIDFFKKWFKEAESSDQIIESNAMTVSTVDVNNNPSSRVVLLKEIKDNSLIFFTNYKSKKGKEIDENPNICASFYWAPLERQVVFKGVAKKTSESYSDTYFKSRPFSSQVGAIVSAQSEIISSYDNLLTKYDNFLKIDVSSASTFGISIPPKEVSSGILILILLGLGAEVNLYLQSICINNFRN